MLTSPSHAVIGCSDLGRMSSFLALFGFATTARATLPAAAARALYGLAGAAEEELLGVAGAERGGLRLVATPHPPHACAPLDSRPFAVDLYSTDIERSAAIAADAGHPPGPIVTFQFGPMTIREAEIHGPDHVIVTLLELATRRPSVLDADPQRLHSEVHSIVWSVREMDRWLPFWLEQAGLVKTTDATFDSAELGVLLGVGERTIRSRLAVMADAASRPARLEMIEFLGEDAAEHPDWPLHAGLHAPAFHVDDLEAAVAALSGASFGEVVVVDSDVHRGARAVTAVAPGDLRFELWEEG